MAFKTEFGNILDYESDAIVMPANPKPVVGNGVDRLIYHEAGRNRLLKARQAIGEIEFGSAAITDAYDLRKKGFKSIIHAVSPAYDGGEGASDELLKSCYENSLNLAVDNGCKSIAFPLLSTGVLKYPVDKARNIAEGVCKLFLVDHDIDVTLVIYDGSKNVTDADRDELTHYIEENSYLNLDEDEYNRHEREWSNLPEEREERMILSLMRKQIARKKEDEKQYQIFIRREAEWKRKSDKGSTFSEVTFNMSYMTPMSLDSYINRGSRPTFNEVFEKFRKQNNAGSYADICRKANLHEYTLSKLRKGTWSRFNRDYLWALAVALKINLDETEELFNSCGMSSRGGYNLQPNEESRERALEFFVMNKWGIHDINIELDNRGMALLGDGDTRVA